MNLLFDTSVWIEHLRRGALDDLTPRLRRGWVLMIDAVVASELRAGCRSKRERRVVERLLQPFDRSDRLLVPERTDFQRAATAISRLGERGVTLASAGGGLLDALIAACAAREGALLVTVNEADFARLATVMPLLVEPFDAFATRLSE